MTAFLSTSVPRLQCLSIKDEKLRLEFRYAYYLIVMVMSSITCVGIPLCLLSNSNGNVFNNVRRVSHYAYCLIVMVMSSMSSITCVGIPLCLLSNSNGNVFNNVRRVHSAGTLSAQAGSEGMLDASAQQVRVVAFCSLLGISSLSVYLCLHMCVCMQM
jgi:hypothetical protein